MGEIDTKPIESVQAALSIFGEKGDQRKHRSSSSSSDGENEKGELEGLQKEVATYKVQLEAKESAYMQLLLKLQQSEEKIDDLSDLLSKSQLERDQSMDECIEARTHVDELKTKVREMSNELSETIKAHDQQLTVALTELKSTQAELLSLITELAAEREMKMKAMSEAEAMQNAAAIEKEKTEELVKQVEELEEDIIMLKMAALEAEEEKTALLSEKDAELENTKEQIQELEDQLDEKCDAVSSLQTEVEQAKEQFDSSVAKFETLKAKLEAKERNCSDQDVYIEVLEMEAIRLKHDVSNANESLAQLSCDVELLTSDLQDARAELKMAKEKEAEAEVEIALLKSELHKSRSKIAAAEAAEVRADGVKSGLYLAVQQLAAEAGEAKEECNRLKHESDEEKNLSFDAKNVSFDEKNVSFDDKKYEITIPMEEYEALVNKEEVEVMKKDVEAAMGKVGEFRTRAEQAISRAEAAEKAKEAVEVQLRSWREQKQRRKAAMAALREASASRGFNPPPMYDGRALTTHPPLGKVLNMKF